MSISAYPLALEAMTLRGLGSYLYGALGYPSVDNPLRNERLREIDMVPHAANPEGLV